MSFALPYRHNVRVATATVIPASRLHGHHDRPSMVSVGTIVWLSSELMFFAALFAAYFTIRAVSPELWAQETEKLNIPFASVNTTILVLSSVTCQLGVFAAERGQEQVDGLDRVAAGERVVLRSDFAGNTESDRGHDADVDEPEPGNPDPEEYGEGCDHDGIARPAHVHPGASHH